MTSTDLTTIIDAFNAVRPLPGEEAIRQWTLCVNSFITHSVTRNILTEAQVDDFYSQLRNRNMENI